MFHAKIYIFRTNLSGMIKTEYIIVQWIYIHIRCIYMNYTAKSFTIWWGIKSVNAECKLCITIQPHECFVSRQVIEIRQYCYMLTCFFMNILSVWDGNVLVMLFQTCWFHFTEAGVWQSLFTMLVKLNQLIFTNTLKAFVMHGEWLIDIVGQFWHTIY